MKHLIITALIVVATVSAQGAKSKSNALIIGSLNIAHLYALLVQDSTGKMFLGVEMPTRNYERYPDSLIIHTDKKNFRWINDSTAVIKKS